MKVREVEEADFAAWAAMRHRLWPDEDAEELARETREFGTMDPPCAAFIAETAASLVGFIEVGVRSYAEGAPTGPAAYVEAVWVEPDFRRTGVARALLARAEEWALANGLSHLGSDALLENEASRAWHQAAGFQEIERIVVFGKAIG